MPTLYLVLCALKPDNYRPHAIPACNTKRILALGQQAKSLVDEEQWLATGSLGKGHGWETVVRLVAETQSRRTSMDGGMDDQRFVKEVKVATTEGFELYNGW